MPAADTIGVADVTFLKGSTARGFHHSDVLHLGDRVCETVTKPAGQEPSVGSGGVSSSGAGGGLWRVRATDSE